MSRVLYIAYYAAYVPLYAGFFFHRCHRYPPWHYSPSYTLFLIVLAGGLAIPPLLKFILRRTDRKAFMVSAAASAALALVAYLVAAAYYYYTQEHPFDPFLQVPPPAFDPASDVTPPGAVRILTLGGSTTRNTWLSEPEMYPSVLQRLLQERHPRQPIAVFNAGMEWYTTRHSLINYVSNMNSWQPHTVIIMHAINDLIRSFSDPDYAAGPYNRLWSHYYGPAIHGRRPPPFAVRLAAPFLEAWFSSIRIRSTDVPLERFVSIRDFERNLHTLVHYAQADGARVVLMTQPSLYKERLSTEEEAILWLGRLFCKEPAGPFRMHYPSARSLARAMSAYNATTRRVAEETGATLVDLAPAIEKSRENFADDVHYTVAGAARVAAVVANAIELQDLISTAD